MSRAGWRLLPALLLGLTLLSGCWHTVALEKRGLVAMLGVDPGPGGTYQVTVAVIQAPGLSPPGPTGGGGTQGTSPLYLRSATAGSVIQAIQEISAANYLYLDFTHLEAMIVSSAVASSGLAPCLEYVARSLEFAQTGWLLVARGGSAASLLRATEKDLPQPNEVLSETVRSTREHSPYYTTQIMTALKEIPLRGVSLVTSGVAVASSPSGSQTVPFVIGADALFRQDRLVGWLEGPAALGWALATNHLHGEAVTVGPPSQRAELMVMGVRRAVEVKRRGGGPPGVTLRLAVDAHLASVPYAGNLQKAPGQVRRLELEAGQELAADVRAGLDAAQAAGSDAFGLGEYVRIYDPGYWRQVRDDWAAGAFRTLPVTVQVTVRISSVGEILCPLVHAC